MSKEVINAVNLVCKALHNIRKTNKQLTIHTHSTIAVPSAQISPRSAHSPSKYVNGSSSGQFTNSLERNSQQPLVDIDSSACNTHLPDERPQSAISNNSAKQTNHIDIMQSEWAQVQAIELVNDGTGLGFGIIGAKTSGVIVKTILAGGVADRDGRLLSGDHILQIGEVNLHEMGSEQVASVLRQSGTHVRLVVARAVDPLKTNQDVDGNAAIVPSRLLADPNELHRYLVAAGYPEIFGPMSTPSSPHQTPKFTAFAHQDMTVPEIPELPETERFIVELKKDSNGLGITIAGYVCEKEELSGIFVKSVAPGSAADCGRIQVNDRIIEVDGQSLQGFSNHQAVDVLKQSGSIVTLCLERYLRGLKFEQLQQAIAANEIKPTTPITTPPSKKPSAAASPATSSRRQSFNDERKLLMARDSIETRHHHDLSNAGQESSVDNEEDLINELSNQHITSSHSTPKSLQKYYVEPKLSKDQELMIINKWQSILGAEGDEGVIIVAQIKKFAASSGLGISLEGTVDVEGGKEVRPHHYIRSILPEGPVGLNGLLKSGDELLEVNNQRLLGMNHMQVVSILKELPQDVRMVCRRGGTDIITFNEDTTTMTRTSMIDVSDSNNNSNSKNGDRMVKAKSDGSLATVGNGDGYMKMKSRSLEPLTGLAMWSSEPQVIELVKGERGLGFSILDYQDPLDPNDTLIVIRSLVPGGVAQNDGRLIPGDRLLFVNDTRLENASLDQAVQALKGELISESNIEFIHNL